MQGKTHPGLNCHGENGTNGCEHISGRLMVAMRYFAGCLTCHFLVCRVPTTTQGVATFLAKADGMLAGLAVADEVMHMADKELLTRSRGNMTRRPRGGSTPPHHSIICRPIFIYLSALTQEACREMNEEPMPLRPPSWFVFSLVWHVLPLFFFPCALTRLRRVSLASERSELRDGTPFPVQRALDSTASPIRIPSHDERTRHQMHARCTLPIQQHHSCGAHRGTLGEECEALERCIMHAYP